MVDLTQDQLEPIIISILKENDAQTYTIRTIREKVAATIGVECNELKKPEMKELLGNIVDKHLSSVVSPVAEKSTEKETFIVKPPKTRAKKAATSPKARNNAKTLIKLKAFVLQCGVRKIWKSELDGLDEKESIKKVKNILKELGVEGTPTAEKCEKIRDRRELAEDVKALDPNKTLSQRELRPRRQQVSSDSDEEPCKPRFDLSAFGDPESE